jgi:excisionase family DNA binding protein
LPQRTKSARRYATVAAAAEYLQCNERTIRRHIADGTLTGYRLGERIIRVDLNELDEVVRPIPTVSDGDVS